MAFTDIMLDPEYAFAVQASIGRPVGDLSMAAHHADHPEPGAGKSVSLPAAEMPAHVISIVHTRVVPFLRWTQCLLVCLVPAP